MGVPDDAGVFDSYQNESETATLLSTSSPSSPSHQRRHGSSGGGPAGAGKEDVEDVRKIYKRALGTGYMLAMGVCGIVLVALGSTLDDLAENAGTTSIAVSCPVTQEEIGMRAHQPSPRFGYSTGQSVRVTREGRELVLVPDSSPFFDNVDTLPLYTRLSLSWISVVIEVFPSARSSVLCVEIPKRDRIAVVSPKAISRPKRRTNVLINKKPGSHSILSARTFSRSAKIGRRLGQLR